MSDCLNTLIFTRMAEWADDLVRLRRQEKILRKGLEEIRDGYYCETAKDSAREWLEEADAPEVDHG